MLIHEARVGMKVIFGRGNGEQTLGEIVKVNPSKAKVKTLESRGNGRGSDVGSVWTVPYSLMKPANGVLMLDEVNSKPIDPAIIHEVAKGLERNLPLPVYMPYGDARIVEAIIDCYTQLSPEYLTADGERPMNEVVRLRNSLNARLNHLEKALGRQVSETAAYAWEEARKKEAV
jgi:hypothetical protein